MDSLELKLPCHLHPRETCIMEWMKEKEQQEVRHWLAAVGGGRGSSGTSWRIGGDSPDHKGDGSCL